MQAVIGALRVNLGLDSAQFERGAKRSQSAAEKLQKDLRRMATVAAAAGAALVAMAGRGAQEIDRLSKAGQRIGTTIGGMRALELAADEAGVSVGSLTDSVQNLDREIAAGSKAAADGLARLGLAASDIEGLEADEKLALIADRVKSMGLSTGEASVLLREFGIRNRDMVLLLMEGGDALRDARSDVDDYGLALSQVDATAVEVANDQIGRLRLVSTLLAQNLARALIPAFGRLAQRITDSLREGGLLRSFIDGFVRNLDVLAGSFAAVAVVITVKYIAAIVKANIATFTFAGAIKAARLAVASFLGPLGLVFIAIGAVAAAFIAQRDANNDASSAMNSAESAAKDLSIELDVLATNDLPEASAATVTLANDNLSLARSAFAAARAQVELSKATQQAAFNQASMEDAFLPGVENPGRAALEAANAELSASIAHLTAAEAELNARVMEGNKIVSENVSLTKDLGTVLDETSKKAKVTAKELTSAAAEAKERFANLRASMESSMESGFMSIIDGTMRAKDAFKSMASEIIKELFRVLVVQRLVAGISGFVGGMFGPGMTSAPAVNPLSGLSGAQMLPQLANGTSYAQGGMTLVGERGPELVNMPRGSQVIDARRTASRMGNGDIVQNFSFNLSANGDESVRRIVSQAAPQIVEAAKAGVADAVRRGGSYGRAFA